MEGHSVEEIAGLSFHGSTFERRQWFHPLSGCELRLTSIQGTYHLDVERNPRILVRT